MRIQGTPGEHDPKAAAAERAIGLNPEAIRQGTLVYEWDDGHHFVRYEGFRVLTDEEAERFRRAWLGEA